MTTRASKGGPVRLTEDTIRALRMQTLGLVGDAVGCETPRDVVAHHLAMQAQDFKASRWAVGSRMVEARDEDVIAAYDAGQIVRSWPMRGTVHVTLAEELPWMLEVMGVRALSGVERRWDALGIDRTYLERARDVARERLRGGGRATRADLSAWWAEEKVLVEGQRLYHVVWYLSQTGTLVQGPVRDGDHELVLLDEWIPSPRRLTRDEALAELGRRYLQARGPATLDDLVHWTKLPKRDAKVALTQPDIVLCEGPEGATFALAEHLDTLSHDADRLAGQVHALAAFDEHLIGYRTRDAVIDPAHLTRVDPARNGVFRWTLVDAGRVVATWKRTRRANHTLAEVDVFGPLTEAGRAAAPAALERWGRFDGTEVKVAWG